MFTSRKTPFSPYSSPQTVIIEIPSSAYLDNKVVPATLDYILQDISSTLTRHQSSKPNIVVLALDRHPAQFDNLCKRSAIPAASVVDGFSQWFPLHHSGVDDAKPSERGQPVHVAAVNPASNSAGSVAFEVGAALDSSIYRRSEHRVVVVDSLSTILRYRPGVNTFLDLRDALASSRFGSREQHSLTIVAVFRAHDQSQALLSSLKKICETHVLLLQGEPSHNIKQSSTTSAAQDERDVVTLQICRRKLSGRVQLDRIDARVSWQDVSLADVIQKSAADVEVAIARRVQDERHRQEQMMEQLGLSFRVSLSSSEREVRAAAGLPYLHRDENLANRALQLHLKSLQVGNENDDDDGFNNEDWEYESDADEELFSEDV